MVEWDEAEIVETVIAVKDSGEKFIFSGDVSDMWKFIFSDQWTDHMYDEYPSYFFEDMLVDLKKHGGEVAEIEMDIVYHFGEATEDDVKEYMLKHKNEGPRFLVMPRTETVTMACAYLRGYTVGPIGSI